MEDIFRTNDERTNKLLELFNFGNDTEYIFRGVDSDMVFNIELNEFDCWRLFNYFQDLWSRNKSSVSKHMEYQVTKAKEIKELMESDEFDTKMFLLRNDAQKRFLINLNHPKKIKEELKLPFDNLFLDTDLQIEDSIRIIGILGMFYPKEKIGELNDKSIKIINKELLPKASYFCLRYLVAQRIEKDVVFYFEDCIYNLEKGSFIKRPNLYFNDSGDKLTDWKTGEKIQKYISSFITNVLLFFNEPRVITYVFNRPQKNREKKGLIPIPSEIRTRIHIDLQNYIETIYFTGQSHSKIGFAFWVIGHYRILKSDFYKNKKGEKIWIPSHIRGEGLMPPHIFEIVK